MVQVLVQRPEPNKLAALRRREPTRTDSRWAEVRPVRNSALEGCKALPVAGRPAHKKDHLSQ